MTRGEWLEIAAMMAANWPHRPMPDASLAKFYADLKEFEAADVQAAVEALYRDGREFPPSGAQIRGRLLEHDDDAPDFAAVYGWLMKLGMAGYTSPYYGDRFPRTVDRCERVLASMPAAVRDFVLATGRAQLIGNLNDPDNGEARLRWKWEQWQRRRTRDQNLIGLPGGLGAVGRVNGGEPRRLDVGAALRALPGGQRGNDGSSDDVAATAEP